MYDGEGNEIKKPISKLMVVFRSVMIIRLALLDGVALFGLVLLLLSASNGSLHERSIIWLALTPVVILLGFVFLTFPTKEKIVENIDTNILRKLRTYS